MFHIYTFRLSRERIALYTVNGKNRGNGRSEWIRRLKNVTEIASVIYNSERKFRARSKTPRQFIYGELSRCLEWSGRNEMCKKKSLNRLQVII